MNWGSFGGDQGKSAGFGKRPGMGGGSAAQVYSGQPGAAGATTPVAPDASANTIGPGKVPGWGNGGRTGAAAPTATPASQVYSSSPLTTSGQTAGGTWEQGEQGAAGAWSNGYNPHQVQSTTQQTYAPAPRPQRQAAPAPVSGADLTGGSGQGGYVPPNDFFTPGTVAYEANQQPQADPRSNPNNTMSEFVTPDGKHYYDFDNEALRASPGAGVKVTSPASMNPNQDWQINPATGRPYGEG